MKKTILLAALLWVAGMAAAKPIDPATARLAAANLLGKTVVDATPKSLTECYLFTGADGIGFVLVANDDCVQPLLAYSHTSPFPAAELPCNLAAWLDGYQAEIAWARKAGATATREAMEEWTSLLDNKYVEPKEAVAPLLASKWNQSPYYNTQCPYDDSSRSNAVVGCVATATSQIMRYWGHPAQGRGSHAYRSKRYDTISVDYSASIYDWANMPDELTATSSQVEVDAVAKLCYEVGVMMDMNYSPTGSGAYEHSGGMLQRFSAERGLENHYFYNPSMYAAFKEGYDEEEWKDLLISELEAQPGHPILYTGSSSSGGHAFVVDGVNSKRRFHINWGWGGSGDGYFSMGHLSAGEPGRDVSTFNEMNNALIGVYPITPNATTSLVAAVSAQPDRGFVIGNGTYPADTDRVFIHAIAHDGYRFDHWASGSRVNPVFYYPTVDFHDTAYFVPLSADTLGYGMSMAPNWDTVYTLTHTEWGIRIPAERVPAGKELLKVENFIYTTGTYILRVYQGEMPDGAPLYEDSLHLTSYGWRSILLRQPLMLDATQPLWITFAVDSVKYPAGICPHTGNPDGSWIKNPDGQWQLVDTNVIGYYTWVMRGIVCEPGNGIAEVAEPLAARLALEGRTLTVVADNPEAPVALYDLQGRLCLQRTGRLRFDAPAAGLYLLRVGDRCKKIVVQ